VLLLTKEADQWRGGPPKAMVIRDVCPRCQSSKEKKNGHRHNGTQNQQGKDCGRQCVQCSAPYLLADDPRTLIAPVLVARMSWRGIGRAVGGTRKWCLRFLVQCFEALPAHLHGQPVTCTQHVRMQRLEVAAEEMASVVQQKANQPWNWSTMDAKTRQGLALHVGDRRRRSAKRLWAQIPATSRQHATLYTDQSVVYDGVLPTAQHRAISTLARKTNHLERFNNTLRQRVARLVREALSCSKQLAHHIGASQLCTCHYNLTKAPALHG
jgi:insertion element IS1 protein InsB